MSVRPASGHVTELGAGCRSPGVDVTTDCSTGCSSTAAAVSRVYAMTDQPWRCLPQTDAVLRSTTSPGRPTTSCGDRRPSFMISDILGGDRSVTRRSPPPRPTPLVGATAARFASLSAHHLDFAAMAHHRPFSSSTAAAAAACLQRRGGLDDGVDIDRCLQVLPGRLAPSVSGGPWTNDVTQMMTSKRASSYSAECGSDVDVDLDDDNDADSNSSLVGQLRALLVVISYSQPTCV